DFMEGDAGTDTADYSDRTEGVNVALYSGGPASGSLAHDIRALDDEGIVLIGDQFSNDVENVNGGSGPDWIDGSDGPNLINGNGGDDAIYGNGGDDSLSGETGADDVHGDGGVDTVDYSDHLTGLTAVTLNNVADDGTFALFSSEADNVHDDVENVVGGYGANLIEGDDAANVITTHN